MGRTIVIGDIHGCFDELKICSNWSNSVQTIA